MWGGMRLLAVSSTSVRPIPRRKVQQKNLSERIGHGVPTGAFHDRDGLLRPGGFEHPRNHHFAVVFGAKTVGPEFREHGNAGAMRIAKLDID